MSIALAESDAEILASYPVVRQLRPYIAEEGYLALVREMQRGGYHLATRRDEAGEVRAAIGFHLGRSMAWGPYVYVDDLVTDEATRSHGHGAALLSWVEDFGRARGCTELHLDSGVQRTGAHRFYLRERMDIVFFHFKKAIAPPQSP
jgi:GNAT superfamily N-acetyltransferase